MNNNNYQWQTDRTDETVKLSSPSALNSVGSVDECWDAKLAASSIDMVSEAWIRFAVEHGLPHKGFNDPFSAKNHTPFFETTHHDEVLYDQEFDMIDREIIGMTDDDDHIEENVLDVDFGYGSDVIDVSA